MDPSLLIMLGVVPFAALAGYFFGKRSPQRKELPRAVTNKSESKVEELFADAPIGYLEVDKEGTVQWANQCECALRGLKKEQIVGRAYWELKTGDDQRVAQQSFSGELAAD